MIVNSNMPGKVGDVHYYDQKDWEPIPRTAAKIIRVATYEEWIAPCIAHGRTPPEARYPYFYEVSID